MKPKSSLWIRMSLGMTLALCLVFFATQNAQAASINHQGTIPADQTVDDDLIISGETVTIDGTVNGLVLAAGNSVTVNGTINGDLFAFGADVVIGPKAVVTGNVFGSARLLENSGRVDGSFFGGAMTLKLNPQSSIARNLFFGGYNFEALNNSSVGRDFYMGGYQAVMNGSIGQNVNFAGGAAQIGGNIGGDARLELSGSDSSNSFMKSMSTNNTQMPEALPAGLSISPEAVIAGKLTYTSPVEYASAIQSQPAGGVVYQTPVPGNENSSTQISLPANNGVNHINFMNTVWNFVRNFIALTIVGLLLVWLAPKLLQKTVAAAQSKPFQSAGVGVLSILIAYPGAFIAAIALIGIAILLALLTLGSLNSIVLGLGLSSLGIVMAVFTVLLKFVSKCIVAFLVGSLLMNQLFPNKIQGHSIWAMVIGVFLYALIGAIPVIGWIVSLVVTLVGLGAIWYGLVVKPTLPAIPQAA